jgi:hypothetical protein
MHPNSPHTTTSFGTTNAADAAPPRDDHAAFAAIHAALAAPPLSSSQRDKQLLDLAAEAGVGGHALSLLERVDIAHLSAHDRITYLRHVTACAAWFEAFQTIATAAVAGPTSGWAATEVEERVQADLAEAGADTLSETERSALTTRARDEAWEVRERAIALEVSMATRVSPRTAGRRIESARLLLEQLPRAIDQSWSGRWGYGHLRVTEKELLDVPAPLREAVLDDVLPYAETDHPRRLSERLRKSLARRDAIGMAARTRERSEQRQVGMWNLGDGQSRLAFTGPYEAVHRAHRQLGELSHARRAALRAQDPTVTCAVDSLKFDAVMVAVERLHGLLDRAESGGSDGVGHLASTSVHNSLGIPSGNLAEPDPWAVPRAGTPGSRPRQQATVIVDAATALHLAEEPGFVPGYGWVPAPIAREILADSQVWRRWLLDESSRELIDAGSQRYRPTEALRDLVAGRDVTCTADTCTRPANEAQVDHAIDFDGGNTTPRNLHVVCGPDHLAVTAGHFIIDSDDEGRAVWVSTGSGHSYPSRVEPLHERSTPSQPDGSQTSSHDEPHLKP